MNAMRTGEGRAMDQTSNSTQDQVNFLAVNGRCDVFPLRKAKCE